MEELKHTAQSAARLGRCGTGFPVGAYVIHDLNVEAQPTETAATPKFSAGCPHMTV